MLGGDHHEFGSMRVRKRGQSNLFELIRTPRSNLGEREFVRGVRM
jgi:hypothetical protein